MTNIDTQETDSVCQKKKKCPNNKKEIYNDKYRQIIRSSVSLEMYRAISNGSLKLIFHCINCIEMAEEAT
jgi:hypothetical protein